jgi:hypothetical protein
MAPLVARAINLTFGFPTIIGFKVIGYFGVWAELFGIYLLARHFKANFKTSITIMLVPAFALYNTKFLLFDFYRPDQLGYAFLIFAFLALLNKKRFLAMVLSLIGLNTREFLIIPPLILLYEIIQDWRAGSAKGNLLLRAIAIAGSVGFVLLLPRLLIPVKFTQQIVDPINDPKYIFRLLGLITDSGRDFNYLFNLGAYFLPLLILFTRERIKHAWDQLGFLKPWLFIYILVTLIGMMVGGTDMMRYVTYLVIPQSIFLIFILQDCKVDDLEITLLFIAMILFNRITYPFPIWDFQAYLDFYAGYGDRVNFISFVRLVELLAYTGLGILLRMILSEAGQHKISLKLNIPL